jgi:hypothetical protein|tara:strand:- start:456 stop:800 length:345 start_codon:yes stop_codon:yes gene_type:complete
LHGQAVAWLKPERRKTMTIDTKYTAPTGRSYNNDATITLVATPKGKLPAQAGKIIECLVKADGHSMTVQQLVGTDAAGLDSALDAVGLNTVQTPQKIWSFYKARLIDEGLITVS